MNSPQVRGLVRGWLLSSTAYSPQSGGVLPATTVSLRMKSVAYCVFKIIDATFLGYAQQDQKVKVFLQHFVSYSCATACYYFPPI